MTERTKPFVLLTNDDGFAAPGIQKLMDMLSEKVNLLVVAPKKQKSGAGHSITLGADMQLEQMEDFAFTLDGTPVDCAFFAFRKLIKEKPDLVISGINRGANLGSDTLYSGTVGAALYAAKQNVPALAVSLVSHEDDGAHYDSAVSIVEKVLDKGHWKEFSGRVININVPNLPQNEIQGMKTASLADMIYTEGFEQGGCDKSWRYVKETPVSFSSGESDSSLIKRGFASVSILKPDLFCLDSNERLKSFITDI